MRDSSWVDDDGVAGPDDDTCLRELLLRSVRVCGVGTVGDVVDVHRLGSKSEPRVPARAAARRPRRRRTGRPRPGAGLGATGVRRPRRPGRGARPVLGRSRTTLLSPFDSLVWHRERTARLFGFDYVMELYVPQEQRQYGYFTMPVLHGGRLVARVDPKREGAP